MDAKWLPDIPRDDLYYFNTGCARKAWLSFGCHRLGRRRVHRFLLWAPHAERVSLVGDFNGWDVARTPMERLEEGVWCCFVSGLANGALYKYAVTGQDGRTVLKADPFAACTQWGVNTASVVYEKEFRWSDEDYLEKRKQRDFLTAPMSIYELHLGSWQAPEGKGSAYRRLADQLAAYCRDMGYTHVELLPLTEYPYDGSWGYQVTGYYAPTSRYGSPEDFAYLVNRLHRAGIGVIMDWVPAHFPRDEHGLANFDGTPLFECKEKRMAEHPEWGTLIFDYASPQVQSFLVSSACKFFEVYHIDGIRVDAVSSMLYLNYARAEGSYTPNREGGNINLDAVDFLKKLNTTVLTNYPGTVTIAEEATAFPGVTLPPALGGLGFCLKWDMGYMHDTLDYMAMDPYFRSHHQDKLSFSMMYAFRENYVLAYSHDEVVHGKKSMLSKMYGDYEQKFASLRALYGYQFAHPGKKHCFMGSEFGQFIEWDWHKPLDWLLLDYPRHRELRDYYRELNRIYTRNPALFELDHGWEGFQWLNVNDSDRSSVAFLRRSKAGQMLICVCNFTPVAYEDFVIGLPCAGTLRVLLSSDEARFGGSGGEYPRTLRSRKEGFYEFPRSVAVPLPAMSCLYYEFRPAAVRADKGKDGQG